MLEVLKQKNPGIEVYSVFDEAFESYGQVIEGIDVSEIIRVAEGIALPEHGSAYVPTEPRFEKLAVADTIRDELFGTLPTQIGYCWGYNTDMDATEWHTATEINIAVTDVVLILGHRWEVKNDTIDSSAFKAFYAPKGTVLECFATTLHYCPCQAQDEGFGWVVALPKDTNTTLEKAVADKRITAKNKWLYAHNDNQALIDKGAVPGITGVNHSIKY